jgi:YD repeat-containing protein
MPDGTIYKDFYANGAWQKRLSNESKVYLNATDEGNDVWQRRTTVTWLQDDQNATFQINPRVRQTVVSDGQNNRKTTIGYTAPFNLPDGSTAVLLGDVYEWDGATILRRSHTDYTDPASLNNAIVGLPAAQYVCDGAGLTTETACGDNSGSALVSKVTRLYDQPGAIDYQGAPTQHDQAYDSTTLAGRGNLTSVTRWDVTGQTPAVTTNMRYNTAGSLISTSDPAGHTNRLFYADDFSTDGNDTMNVSVVTMAYPTRLRHPDNNDPLTDGSKDTKLKYHYDLGARTRIEGPPPQDQTQGAVQTITYDAQGRVSQITSPQPDPQNANNTLYPYTRYIYGPNYVASFSSINTVAQYYWQSDAYSMTVFDGLGRAITAGSNNPGSSFGYRATSTKYDLMGRVWKQSNPAETNDSWVPSGPDDGAGWLYTTQTYDWKGRPLVTTNQDGTQKYATYTGCGCAGGEVVTLTDEVGRRQKVYSDVLGRQWKSEVLNWDGTVYDTTTSSFNARDQVTLIRQWAGAENGGAYQDTTFIYDGHGRLDTKHAPEQQVDAINSASTDHTTWTYNNDDTVNTTTDARRVIANFSYNNRHLVTGISYDRSNVPAGANVAATASVGFGYDAAGNRTLMSDGLGSTTYTYNQLSQMTSEARTFTGFGNFTISYGYNLAGNLNSITDPFAAQVGYNYDNAGRVSAVTGSGFGNISSYASNFQYRATGALKHLTFGSDGQTIDMSYNARLEPTNFISPNISLTYQYFDDGRLKYSHDNLDARFDRSYGFDHAGRMAQALSGAAARGEADTNNRPYKQDYTWDTWDNLTSRTGKHWSHNNIFFGSYVNNRKDGWQYDADGRNTVSNSLTSTYDAAGRLRQTSGPQRRNNPPLVLINDYDGDGQRVKKIEYGETFYLLRATVLGGAVLTEIYGTANQFYGQKQKGHVYVNGSELAEQYPSLGAAIFTPSEPSGMEHVGALGAQLDPLGNDVGEEDPYLPDNGGDPGFSYPHLGDMSDPGSGCVREGIPVPCSTLGKSRLSWWSALIPRFDRWLAARIDPRRTAPTFPTAQSQITLGQILRGGLQSSPIGRLFSPTAADLKRFVNPTFFSDPQNPTDDLNNFLKNNPGCAEFMEVLEAAEGGDHKFSFVDLREHPEVFQTKLGPVLSTATAYTDLEAKTIYFNRSFFDEDQKERGVIAFHERFIHGTLRISSHVSAAAALGLNPNYPPMKEPTFPLFTPESYKQSVRSRLRREYEGPNGPKDGVASDAITDWIRKGCK